jgi:AcrR family transcriptional regulator
VLAATIDELAARPYEEISVESIATRAGVHKTTVYRRWATKARLVAQALESAADARIEVPDTGALRDDLRALADSVAATLASAPGAATLRALLAGATRSEEISDVVRGFWAARLERVGVVVARGIARGEVPPGTDPGETIHALVAPLYYRLLVTGEPLTGHAVDLSVRATFVAARAGTFVDREASRSTTGRAGVPRSGAGSAEAAIGGTGTDAGGPGREE